jgi:hypothetical protein
MFSKAMFAVRGKKVCQRGLGPGPDTVEPSLAGALVSWNRNSLFPGKARLHSQRREHTTEARRASTVKLPAPGVDLDVELEADTGTDDFHTSRRSSLVRGRN